MKTASILSVGDELTSGLTLNTNGAWLSGQLTALGIGTIAHLTVGDDLAAIAAAIGEWAAKCDVLLISGGLGPTEDDVTRPALAQALGETLVQDDVALVQLQNWFERIGRPMSASNIVQAQRPASATCLVNTAGTAPGLRARKGGCLIFVVPGVPTEMREMFTRSVLPELQKSAGDRVTLTAKLNTFGFGESVLGERIKDLMVRGGNPAVGTTVHEGIVSVRIYATGPRNEALALLERTGSEIRQRLGDLIFGENDGTLEASVADLLHTKQQTIATAESCTGGLLAKLLTDVPGSSTYFLRGWVTYSNQAKTQDVNVPAALIAKHGAVSMAVAAAMAAGARERAATHWGIGITGIAGPGGGTTEKPVGLVWIALAGMDGTLARRFIFPGERNQIRQRAAQMALALLRWKMLGIEVDTLIRPAANTGKSQQ